MKQFITMFAIALLVGCESAVLVNNRPEREPDWNAPATPTEPRQARSEIGPDAEFERAQTTAAPSTQPADQTIETKNTRVESNSN
jgi:hypothetical protein